MAYCTKTDLRNQVIYSIYVRNYSEEGTFLEVEKDLDRIKGLGVDIIWFLPIYPIGQEKRKGILGSPYAIADYRKVNPELGTMDDFKHLVEGIRTRGMRVMLILCTITHHRIRGSPKTIPNTFTRHRKGRWETGWGTGEILSTWIMGIRNYGTTRLIR